MNFATVTLGCIISKPVLQEEGTFSKSVSDERLSMDGHGEYLLEWRRTQCIEAESFSRVDNGQFSGHSQYCSFARCIR